MNYFYPADILLPDFAPKGQIDGEKWAVIACDQHTSEPQYWKDVENTVGTAPSTLKLMLPEIYLSQTEQRIKEIRNEMNRYISLGILKEHKNCGIYLERKLASGKMRSGIIGCIDLEQYDYSEKSLTPIRSTEKTVKERIPPRLRIRAGAALELPHILLLIDDPQNTVIGRFAGRTADAYSFELMENGGSVSASFISEDEFGGINESLEKLGEGRSNPIIFAMGDGNHSLATAKAAYEQLKSEIGIEEAQKHPARYALAEAVNIHEASLEFEPIYRLCKTNDIEGLISAFETESNAQTGNAKEQKFTVITEKGKRTIDFKTPYKTLPVATLQIFLDEYAKSHPDMETDYIHGTDSLENLAKNPGYVGFIFDGMKKSELFEAVEKDGNLPRKTFSMGHAWDKRYYIEARKIVK